MWAAAKTESGGFLPWLPGHVIDICLTPAIRAGIEVIRTVEGYLAVPPGTYEAAEYTGMNLWPYPLDSSFQSSILHNSWYSLILCAENSKASLRFESIL